MCCKCTTEQQHVGPWLSGHARFNTGGAPVHFSFHFCFFVFLTVSSPLLTSSVPPSTHRQLSCASLRGILSVRRVGEFMASTMPRGILKKKVCDVPGEGLSSNCQHHSGCRRASKVPTVVKWSSDVRGGEKVAKPVCMCSPTNHPGSFRCRLHRVSAPVRGDERRASGASQRFNQGSS